MSRGHSLFLYKEIYLHAVRCIILVIIAVEEQTVTSCPEHLCNDVFHQHTLIYLQFVKHQLLIYLILYYSSGIECH